MWEPTVSTARMPEGQQPGRLGQGVWRAVALAHAAGRGRSGDAVMAGSYDFLSVRASRVAGLEPASQGSLEPPAVQHVSTPEGSLEPPAVQHVSTPVGLDGRYGQHLSSRLKIQGPLAIAVAGSLLL